MIGGGNKRKTARARQLRSAQTDAERRLWYRLNNRQLAGRKFVRQEPIGPYFVDFVCRERKLVVELDGSQHAESDRDRARDAFLAERGYRVLRFWNHEAMQDLNSVLDTIFAALESEHFDGEARASSGRVPSPARAAPESASPRKRGEVGGAR